MDSANYHRPIPLKRGRGGLSPFCGSCSREKEPEVAVEVAGRLGKPLFMAIKVNEPREVVHWKEVVGPLLDEVEVTVVHHAGPEETDDLIARARAVLLALQWPEPLDLS